MSAKDCFVTLFRIPHVIIDLFEKGGTCVYGGGEGCVCVNGEREGVVCEGRGGRVTPSFPRSFLLVF